MNKSKIGTWITTYNPSALDVISKCNFDWICIDMEHSSITLDQLENLLNVLDKNKSTSFVRVSENNKTEIKKVLDLGAKGIIVPMVNSALDARNAISYATYPPKGQRGFALARAQGYGYDMSKYSRISKNIKIVLQIETIKAIKNLDEILKVKGLYSTMIGPRDLSGSIGKPGDYKDKNFLQALQKYEKISKINKVSMGMHVAFPEVETLKKFIKKKYTFLAIGTDMTFLGDAIRDKLSKIKK
jgi:2-dehydro-3-deoxyglucarate aldolase